MALEQDAIEGILGWEFHPTQEVTRPNGTTLRLGSWSPPGVSQGDVYGVTVTCDHLLEWLHQNTSREFYFGGRSGSYWATLDNSVTPLVVSQPTLLAALESLARYVHQWKEML